MCQQKALCLILICTSNIIIVFAQRPKNANINPSIIQDTRDLPNTNGAFGFLYQTEDGIAHGAVGEPNGVVRGRYTYTDPTGLKVNFNYNAGSRNVPSDYKISQNDQPVQPRTRQNNYQNEERDERY